MIREDEYLVANLHVLEILQVLEQLDLLEDYEVLSQGEGSGMWVEMDKEAD